MVITEPQPRTGAPGIDELRAALRGVYGTDYGLRGANWISRFTDAARQAAAYRAGRVLLAGDAAHIHSPHGGQGLDIGVQDAVNLGWKLAQVVAGVSPESLLDTYHAERHPVGARVLHATMAQVALSGPGDRHQALRDVMEELLGRRMPDLDVETADGPTRVSALLHEARPVLLDLVGTDGVDVSAWADRVRRVGARHEGAWELPLIGGVPPAAAVLIRPDGHVAWAGDPTDPELPRALATWFGAAAPAR
jgi:FAD binding domain/Aromatic-ring hydroxylase, C-terminal